MRFETISYEVHALGPPGLTDRDVAWHLPDGEPCWYDVIQGPFGTPEAAQEWVDSLTPTNVYYVNRKKIVKRTVIEEDV